MPQVEVNIQTDGVTNAQTDASSGGKCSDKMQRQMPQVEVNVQTDGDISAQTDASIGDKYSDRWGYKCTDRCHKGR
jgi:hypothetical protein